MILGALFVAGKLHVYITRCLEGALPRMFIESGKAQDTSWPLQHTCFDDD